MTTETRILQRIRRMERLMSVQFDALKAQIDAAIVVFGRVTDAPSNAAIQAEADRLAAAIAAVPPPAV